MSKNSTEANYNIVKGILNKSPELRNDFELINLVQWLKQKCGLFKKLRAEMIIDVLKNCQFVTKKKDQIIIRQGDLGDCMYILIRGRVTIYIQYQNQAGKKDKDDADDTEKNQSTSKTNTNSATSGIKTSSSDDTTTTNNNANINSENLRQQLGTFVTNLDQGATFGEMALISEDCIRTASIVITDPSDLIVIDRQLYNRSVKEVLQKEFEDKRNFIASNPFFSSWPNKYKKHLSMALEKEILPYDFQLCKQGQPVNAVYFILSGEIKQTVDPKLHKRQYCRLYEENDIEDNNNNNNHLLARNDYNPLLNKSGLITSSSNSLNGSKKKKMFEICLLGCNETVGDIETILELPYHLQTSTTTQRSNVLVLETRHFERLVTKRNPKTIDLMREQLELKYQSRSYQNIIRNVPIYKILLQKIKQLNKIQADKIEARNNMSTTANINNNNNNNIVNNSSSSNNNNTHNYNTSSNNHHNIDSNYKSAIGLNFDSFIPPRGPLIDLFGPGTVFYRIRQKENARILRENRRRLAANKQHLQITPDIHNNGQTNVKPNKSSINLNDNQLPTNLVSQPQIVDYQTSDPILTNLENRMRAWLSYETKATSGSAVNGLKANSMRVIRLQRSHIDVAHKEDSQEKLLTLVNQGRHST